MGGLVSGLFGGGGSSGGSSNTGSTQSTATSYNTNIPEYAQPYVTSMLNATQQQLFNVNDQGQITGFNPYRAYGGTYDAQGNQISYDPSKGIAGFSPLQQQAQTGVANLQTPGQFGTATGLSTAAGVGALGSTAQAADYGAAGQAFGAQGAGQAGMASQNAARQAAMYGRQGAMTGAQALGYGAQGAASGQQGLGFGQEATGLGQQAALTGQQAANLAQQQGLGYGALGSRMGQAAASLAPQAQGYGQAASNIGMQGLGYGSQGAGYGQAAASQAGQGYGAQSAYQAQATSPAAMQAYMNPYIQASLAPQLNLLAQQTGIQGAAQQSAATQAGAFGGSRSALANALVQQQGNLAAQQAIAQGYNQAYNQAQQAQQFGANLGLQGLQAGTAAQQAGIQGAQAGLAGLGTAITGQQAGLSGLGQANQLYGTGITGAQAGLSGLQGALAGSSQALQGYGTGISGAQAGIQGAQAGIQGAQAGLAGVSGAQAAANLGLSGVGQQIAAGQLGLAGTAQGIQGAQVGLQGVQGQQAGYGLANQAAGTLGTLGTQGLAAQQAILGQQNQFGAQQQAYQQQILNQAMQDYANAQQYPLMELGTMSNMLRGLPLQSTTTQQYVAQPNAATQAIGTAGALTSLYKAAGSKKGGIIDAEKYASGGAVVDSVESKLYDMSAQELQKELQSPSGEIRKMAKRIMLEKQVESMAGGGIIAFSNPTDENNQSLVSEPDVPPQAAPTGIASVQQPAAPVNVGTTPEALKNLLAQQAQAQFRQANRPTADIANERAAYLGPDLAAQEYRKSIMEQRANAKDEAVRQNWLRAAEFFADWGSRPGNTLSAGMSALKTVIPSVVTDQEAQKKYLRDIDKVTYELDKAARAEKAGDFDKAAEHKDKAGDIGARYLSSLSTLVGHEEVAANTLKAAAMRSAGSSQDNAMAKVDKAIATDPQTKMLQEGFKKDNPQPGTPEYQWYADNLEKIRQYHYNKAGIKTDSANIALAPYPQAQQEQSWWGKTMPTWLGGDASTQPAAAQGKTPPPPPGFTPVQ